MTAVDVDALAKLREAATAGPWITDAEYVVLLVGPAPERYRLGETIRGVDAALIVAAVNALPDLLAEVRRGRALREAVEGLADSLDVDSCDPMPDDRARLLYETAQRIRAAVAAVDGGERR